jgi:DNA-binding transcriptional ArsR family regulator
MSDLFDVLADTTRRMIVARLNEAKESGDGLVELSVGELVEAVGGTQPTVSKHLKVLREADIVRVREDGQHRFYRLNPTALAPVAGWLDSILPASGGAGAMELQKPYLDLWAAGYMVGTFIADTRDAILGLVGYRSPR